MVTQDAKQWARQVIEQEKEMQTEEAPANSLAVLYFQNETNMAELDNLQKGMALMLITDLSKVENIQLIERVKVQALIEEMGLGASGLVEPETSARFGRLLGAENLVGGNILKENVAHFRIISDLLDVENEIAFARTEVQGELLNDLFRMEKELVFSIIDFLEIELTPDLETELKKPFTTNLNAFMYYIQAIEQSDKGDYNAAKQYYDLAFEEDPSLEIVQVHVQELYDLKLIGGRAEAYSEPDEPIAPATDLDRRTGKDLADKNDPTARENNINTFGQVTVNWNIVFDDEEEGDGQGVQEIGRGSQNYNNGFLTYAVEQEEDLIKREILRMHQEAVSNYEVWTSINTALAHSTLRERDAWFTRIADAKAGRVLKDRSGYWVRVQQYILRPDAQTVQMLNVSLRSGSGNLAGLSSINWTTTLDSAYGGSLRSLPWSNWLNTQTGNGSFISYPTAVAPPVHPVGMAVEFSNPSQETLKESRAFGSPFVDSTDFIQPIESEALTLNGAPSPYQYTNHTPTHTGEYTRIPNDMGGFDYVFADGTGDIQVAFAVIGDVDTVDGENTDKEFKDIWDAMRVNEPGATQIGNNNLEIAIDGSQQVFSQPIDVVYVPMSRMEWKSD